MGDNSRDRLTVARRFLEPSNATHRQYEALRAFFVEGLTSAEAAARFGYTPGSFRILAHQFRNQPQRQFFRRSEAETRPPGRQKRLRDQVVALALFAGLNVIPKRSFLTEYSCRIKPSCYPKLMRYWFDTV